MSRTGFDRLPEGPPHYDYVDGKAVEVNRPSIRHEFVAMRFASFLHEHSRAHSLGIVAPDVDVELPAGNVYGPDIVFVEKDHDSIIDQEKGDIHGAPDLIAEALCSPTRAYDRTERMAAYRAAGVPWIRLVDQETLVVEEYQ